MSDNGRRRRAEYLVRAMTARGDNGSTSPRNTVAWFGSPLTYLSWRPVGDGGGVAAGGRRRSTNRGRTAQRRTCHALLAEFALRQTDGEREDRTAGRTDGRTDWTAAESAELGPTDGCAAEVHAAMATPPPPPSPLNSAVDGMHCAVCCVIISPADSLTLPRCMCMCTRCEHNKSTWDTSGIQNLNQCAIPNSTNIGRTAKGTYIAR